MALNITEENYVDVAEKVILELKGMTNARTGKPELMVTTSKIRNLLSMTADIYNEVVNQKEDKLSADINSRIEYLRVRFLYEAGREKSVKNLVEKAGLIELLKGIKGSRKRFMLFNRYIEALVAFHKYNGGKDM